jgi:SOS response regulatory protein OraA/RecX
LPPQRLRSPKSARGPRRIRVLGGIDVPVVTALRERSRDRVETDLDGRSWRLVPADAVVRAGLSVGRTLDRETARALGRELRRSAALGVALRALRYGDYSRSRLEARLASRGARPDTRDDALRTLEQAGLVDDARVATNRAQTLAGRGYGDAAIRFSLEREGLAGEVVEHAVAGLEPELDRARRLLEAAGGGAKAVRRLAAKGFDAGALEEAGGFADGA